MLDKTKVGQPVVIRFKETATVGRIGDLRGHNVDGKHSEVLVVTPHGSQVETGVVWLHEPSGNELMKLKFQEREANTKGCLYDKFKYLQKVALSS